MVPVLASASAAKQKTSCMLQASCWGIIRSTLAPCGYCLVVDVLRRGCVGLVSVHVTLVGSSGARQVVVDECGSQAGDCG